jgi:hypothetical protein
MTDDEKDRRYPPSKEDQLLQAHQILRTEIIEQLKMTNRATLRGIVAVAAIVGYAVTSGNQIVIGLVPVAMGYIFVRTAETHMWVAELARQTAEIEQELSEPGSPFRWELSQGGVLGDNEPSIGSLRGLKSVPRLVKVLIVTFGYIISVIISLTFGYPDSPPSLLDTTVLRIHFEIFYLVLSVLLLLSGIVYQYHVWAVDAKFIREDSEGSVD